MPRSTKPAATSSCVLKGFDPQSTTSAPAFFRLIIKTAVSLVTWRHATAFLPLRGFSFSNRDCTCAKTGMFRDAHSMDFFPSKESARSLIWYFMESYRLRSEDLKDFLVLFDDFKKMCVLGGCKAKRRRSFLFEVPFFRVCKPFSCFWFVGAAFLHVVVTNAIPPTIAKIAKKSTLASWYSPARIA